MNWFLYDMDLRHEGVKKLFWTFVFVNFVKHPSFSVPTTELKWFKANS